jgi:2-polyprenyl-3-methyl-5-hydroxy-6-metoxy-1,4-benzoquinol methylase
MADSTDNVDYYEQNAAVFFEATAHVDATSLYLPFLQAMPAGAHILDAGCGSGRDSLAFKQRGFQITAFDASTKLAALAAAHIGQPVHVLSFREIQWTREFDGIWACASLLHVPYAELNAVSQRLARALRPSGVMQCSFKYGTSERTAHGRHFTDMDEVRFEAIAAQAGVLHIIDIWQTVDLRPAREHERWLNVLLEKTS